MRLRGAIRLDASSTAATMALLHDRSIPTYHMDGLLSRPGRMMCHQRSSYRPARGPSLVMGLSYHLPSMPLPECPPYSRQTTPNHPTRLSPRPRFLLACPEPVEGAGPAREAARISTTTLHSLLSISAASRAGSPAGGTPSACVCGGTWRSARDAAASGRSCARPSGASPASSAGCRSGQPARRRRT